jgi:predicted nucleic acid-binding protein
MDRVYWDSVCFLGYLLEEEDKVSSCEEVLIDAQDGKLQIVTSALTIAEVLAVRNLPRVPSDQRQTVESFFKNDFILVRGITRRTAEVARGLVWDSGILPKDALHVAAALEAQLPMLHTFDGGLLKKSGKVGGIPVLQIQKPHVIAPRLPLVRRDVEEERA